MFGILEAVSVPHDGVFDTFEDLMRALNDRASKEGYKIVKARSHRVRIVGTDPHSNPMNRCDLVCDRGGRPYKSMATKHKTSTKKTDCPWKAKAVLRKTIGGWVLTIMCDQHNHEPGTPEPPTPPAVEEEDGEGEDAEGDEEGPRPDPDTAVAMQISGVTNAAMRLTGDTFQQLKNDYRKMSQSDRLNELSQMQLRIAAIYAVQNEESQRIKRYEATQRRHSEIDANRRQRQQQKRTRRQPAHQQQPQQPQQQQQQMQSQTPQSGTSLQVQMTQPQHEHHQMHQQQQFQLPDSPSQQLMSLPGMGLAMPQQPQYTNPKRMRSNGNGAGAHQAQ